MSTDRRDALAERLCKSRHPDARASRRPCALCRDDADALMPLLADWAAKERRAGAEGVLENVMPRVIAASYDDDRGGEIVNVSQVEAALHAAAAIEVGK